MGGGGLSISGEAMPRPLKVLLVTASLWPLGVFALFSLNGKVEANWPAMYLVGAAPLLARYLRPQLWHCLAGLGANLALVLTLLYYTHKPFVRVNPGFDRILSETKGFSELAKLPDLEQGPFLFADSFQLVSMLRYYKPNLEPGQWPGVTRGSEYVLPKADQVGANLEAIKSKGGFLLVTKDAQPPQIPGFLAASFKQITYCREGYLKESLFWLDADARPCDALHVWHLARYRAL